MLQKRLLLAVASLAIFTLFAGNLVKAADEKPAGNGCKSLPSFSALKAALDAATGSLTAWPCPPQISIQLCSLVAAYSDCRRAILWILRRPTPDRRRTTALPRILW